jgi:hypothetical protein
MPTHPTTSLWKRRAAAAALGPVACGLLAYNVAAFNSGFDLAGLGGFRRLWTDQALAVEAFLQAQRPLTPEETAGLRGGGTRRYRQILAARTRKRGIEPHQFWRTISDRPFREDRRQVEPEPFDDPGRAVLLGVGFRLLGGVAPVLILWLAPLLVAPLLLWMVWEGFESLHGLAATLLGLLFASSPYVVETLSLTRYAVGFYLIGVLGLVPLALYGLLRPRTTLPGFLLRVPVAGAFFAAAVAGRSGSLFLLPGYVAVFAAGLRRIQPRPPGLTSGRRRLLRLATGTAVATALFLGPYLATRAPRRHATWAALWEGLGDFDRTKGHTWTDEAALEVVRENGGRAPERGESLVAALSAPENEAVLRRLVLNHIREDPAWLLGILGGRLLSTVTLYRLWPWHPRDGLWMRLSSSPNEGYMDKYYGYTATADWIGFGRWQWELPVWLLLFPTATLVLLQLLTWLGPARWREARRTDTLLVLACLSLATLTLPVLVTTAGAQETQALVLVLYLGVGFLAELLVAVRRRPGSDTAR